MDVTKYGDNDDEDDSDDADDSLNRVTWLPQRSRSQ